LTRESNRYSLVWGIDTGVSRWNLNLYNHYVLTTADGSIEELYVKDINVLKSLKQRIYNGEFTNVKQDKLSGFDWSHDQGRDLKHIDFEITVNVPGESDATIIYNIYDTIANEFLLKLQKLDWENQVERNQLIKEFNLVVKEYPNELKMFTQIKSILNKKEFANILRSLLNVEYKLMSEGRKLITADDKALI
jgi:neutral trehalase